MNHSTQDAVSLELATRIADGLPEHPEWLDIARENLERWKRRNADAPSLLRCYAEWEDLLRLPLADIRSALTAETDEGQRIRQNSPFAGVIPARVVWEIKERRRRGTSAA